MNSKPTADSARYPLFQLHNSIRVAEAVRDNGGLNMDVPKASIAAALESSETSGAFLQRLLSARSFGLIEGRGSYRLTERAKRYFFPASEAEKQEAYVSFLACPPVFAELIKRFDGNKLPLVPMLGNILHREMGVSDSWKERVASFFLKSAQAVGVVDNNGFLRYRASQHTMSQPPLNAPSTAQPETNGTDLAAEQTASSAPYQEPGATKGVDVWVYSHKGQTVRLETSHELSPLLWQKLNQYLTVLKPTEEDA